MNLLVLFAVGTVNRDRIETFKRTSKYTKADYDLLVRVLEKFDPLITVAHVLAEVGNLTDLEGSEKAAGPEGREENNSLAERSRDVKRASGRRPALPRSWACRCSNRGGGTRPQLHCADRRL
jgi:hypothetical protein